MKTLTKLAVAAALALATASGPAIAAPPPAAASSGPWATVGYLLNGQWVGGAVLYCDGVGDTSWGNTTTYDTAVWTYYYMCP